MVSFWFTAEKIKFGNNDLLGFPVWESSPAHLDSNGRSADQTSCRAISVTRTS